MEKQKSSHDLHDVKKYLGVATWYYEDFTSTFITFFFCYFNISLFFLGALNKCEKLRKKNSRKTPIMSKNI